MKARNVTFCNIFARLKFCSQSYCGNNAGQFLRVRRQQPVKDNAYVFHVPTTKESAVLPEASTQNLAIRTLTKVSSCRRILAAWDGKVLLAVTSDWHFFTALPPSVPALDYMPANLDQTPEPFFEGLGFQCQSDGRESHRELRGGEASIAQT